MQRRGKLLVLSDRDPLFLGGVFSFFQISILKGLHHYYTLHRLSVQIEVPSRGSISKKKLVWLYKFGMIFFRRMFSTTYLKMR